MIKPIETVYNGYRFRSRLEARWAVFFDAAGIQYQYEPEGFDLGDGMWYLPDFYLPHIGGRTNGLYVEVKGRMTSEDLEKIERFSGYREMTEDEGIRNPVLVVGQIPKPTNDYPEIQEDVYGAEGFWNFRYVDGDDYEALFYHERDGSVSLYGADNVWEHDGFKWFNSAYEKARQARFEHGERP